jgi:hypothetical protein
VDALDELAGGAGLELAAAHRALHGGLDALARGRERAGLRLEERTTMPARAADSAMPEPMKPAPTIPISLI